MTNSTSLTTYEKNQKTAKTKGLIAGGAIAAGIGFSLLSASAFLGFLALVPAIYFTYDWVRYRVDKGIKF